MTNETLARWYCQHRDDIARLSGIGWLPCIFATDCLGWRVGRNQWSEMLESLETSKFIPYCMCFMRTVFADHFFRLCNRNCHCYAWVHRVCFFPSCSFQGRFSQNCLFLTLKSGFQTFPVFLSFSLFAADFLDILAVLPFCLRCKFSWSLPTGDTVKSSKNRFTWYYADLEQFFRLCLCLGSMLHIFPLSTE